MKITTKQKKGQAALEFLTTYGWAFLVILVMIGALAYFGVLDPTRFIPQRCQFGQELFCERFALTDQSVSFELRNNLPGSITLVGNANQSVAYAFDSNPTDFRMCNATSEPTAATNTIRRTGNEDFTCGFQGVSGLESGDKERIHLRITYSQGDAYVPALAQVVFGEVFANVR